MRKVIVCYFILCVRFILCAQNSPDLLLNAGGVGHDEGRHIACDEEGNVYVVGKFMGTAYFGNTTLVSYGDTDLYIAKISNGEFEWAKRAGGEGNDWANSVAVSGTEVYITGRFEETANFNTPSAIGDNEIVSEGGVDVFLAKYNSNGEFQWAKRSGGGGDDFGYGVAVSGTDVYVSGTIAGTANFNTPSAAGTNEIVAAGYNDTFLAKYNNNGYFHWARRAGGLGSTSVSFRITVNNFDVYIAGFFTGIVNFNNPSESGSNEIVSLGDMDVFLAKYNSSGNFQWARRAGSAGLDEAWGIAVDDTDVYVSGIFSGTANFNTPSANGSNEITSMGGHDIFIAKYNKNGNFQWARRAGGADYETAYYGVAINESRLYITGGFRGTANFNTPSLNGINEIISAGDRDIFLAMYDDEGSFKWAIRAGGEGSDMSWGIALNGDDIYITGAFSQTANFNNPSASGSNEITSLGVSDVFLAKYNGENIVNLIYNYKQTISIFPNPNTGNFTVAFGQQLTNATITIQDVLGKTVYTTTVSGDRHNVQLNEAKGIYFVNIQTEQGERTTLKLTVE